MTLTPRSRREKKGKGRRSGGFGCLVRVVCGGFRRRRARSFTEQAPATIDSSFLSQSTCVILSRRIHTRALVRGRKIENSFTIDFKTHPRKEHERRQQTQRNKQQQHHHDNNTTTREEEDDPFDCFNSFKQVNSLDSLD